MMAASSGTEGINWTTTSFSLRSDLSNTSAASSWVLKRIVYADNLLTPAYIAVGNSGTIARSTNGTTWTYNTTVAAAMGANGFNGVAYNSVGNVLIAAGQGGTYYRSTDGVTWTAITSPAGGGTIYNCRYINGFFYLCGFGDMYRSTTGLSGSWTNISGNAAHIGYGIYDIAYGDISGTTARYMYVGNYGIIGTSTDGITWANGRGPQNLNWECNTVIFVPPSGYPTTGEFIIAGASDVSAVQTPTAWRSVNGTTVAAITGITFTTSSSFNSVYYNASLSAKFILLGSYEAWTSPTSANSTWTAQTNYPGTPPTTNYDLTSNGTTVYTIGGTASAASTSYRPSNSTAGLCWGFIYSANSAFTSYTPIKFGTTFGGVAYSSSASKYVAVASNANGIVATSSDGNTWTAAFANSSGTTLNLKCITALGSGVRKFAAATAATQYYSSDGVNWTAATTSYTAVSITSMASDGSGTIVGAAGAFSTIARSTNDGVTWSGVSTGVSFSSSRYVTYTSGVGYFVIGLVGRNMFSPDSATWTAGANPNPSYALFGAAIQPGTNTYIATDSNGTLYYSTTPASGWTANTISSGVALPAALVTGRRSIIVTGNTGGIYSGRSPTLLNSRTSGVTTPLYAATSSAAKVIVVGGNANILSSP